MRNGHRVVGRIVAATGMVVGLTVGVGAFGAGPARAAQTWVVDQEADEAPDPGNQCTAAPGDCSLRQAVDAAVDGDTITIEHLVDPQVTLGQIVVSEDLTIVGEGGQTDGEPLAFFPGTRLDAAHTSRIFDIAAGADVVLTDLLLQRGQAPAGADGGAVRNAGTLRLERVTVTNNRTTGAGDGGGVWSSGSLTVVDVAFSGVLALANTAPNQAGGDGGAIATTGALHVERATFNSNDADGINGGGAVFVHGGTADIVNATFFGNETAGVGGALYADAGGHVSLVSATVARNEAAWGGGGVGTDGGAQLVVVATWFQDNAPYTCAGAMTAGADSLVWPLDSNCPATMTVAAAWTPGVPAPSGVSGGFTETIRLLESSPAVDAIPAPGGVCSLGAQVDQREVARPAVAGCDIGAYEAKENLFIAFDPNRTAITRTFPDGVEQDVPVHAGNAGHGADRTATGVQVDLTFPPGVTVHSVTPPAGTTYDAGTGVWDVGDLAPGVSVPPLIVRLSRNAPGDHVATAVISSDEPGTSETATLTVHEPADRYAVPGGPAEGNCYTLATGCAIEYAVEQAAQETETIYVAPGEHVVAPGASLGLVNKSLVGLDPTDRPLIRGAFAGTFLGLSGQVRITDVDIVNADDDATDRDAGISTSSGSNVTIERISMRSGRRAVFEGTGSAGLTIRDSVLEAVGGPPAGPPLPQALVLSTSATIENVTVIARGVGAVIAITSGQTHTLTNVIARDVGNGTTTGLDVAANAGASIELTSSNYGTTGGAGAVTPAGTAGNQTADPAFVDLAGHDLRQAAGSPTIDAGTGTPAADRRDFEGGPRVFGTSVDIGGDEHGPVIRVTPVSHDYGNLAPGSTASHAFTVTNVGTAPLSVTSFTLTGTDAGQFAITLDDCDLALDPEETCAIAVEFAPTSAGLKSATLEVTSDGGADTASLIGAGLDVTPPEITATVTPAAGPSGWHTTDVNVSWSVVDLESSIGFSDGCGPTTVTTDGFTLLTCIARSGGGPATGSVTLRRDATVPTITGSVDPAAPSASGWYLISPKVSFACADPSPGSGLSSCTEPVSLTSLATPQSVTGTAADVAGNTANATVEGLRVDLVDPTVTCAATPTFTVGQVGAAVSATVEDAHSGPVAATATSPANTAVTGSFTVAVTGSDKAGRSTTVQCPYVVSRVATQLDADPVVSRSLLGLITNVRLSAVLTRTDTGAAIAGQPVTLSIVRGPSCTAVTDANGRATCGNVIVLLNLLGGGAFRASYAGNATYEPSSDTGTIP